MLRFLFSKEETSFKLNTYIININSSCLKKKGQVALSQAKKQTFDIRDVRTYNDKGHFLTLLYLKRHFVALSIQFPIYSQCRDKGSR